MLRSWLYTLIIALGLIGETVMAQKYEVAIVAGGCFWCIEHDLAPLNGVIETRVGYTGGHKEDPSYEDVSSGNTGHIESLEIVYDPEILSFESLLEAFWQKVDPLDAGGQFCDRGPQYRTAVFYGNDIEKEIALNLKATISVELGKNIATDILPRERFYPAEDYHQKYSEKNPVKYKFYRWNCGRDKRVAEIWGQS